MVHGHGRIVQFNKRYMVFVCYRLKGHSRKRTKTDVTQKVSFCLLWKTDSYRFQEELFIFCFINYVKQANSIYNYRLELEKIFNCYNLFFLIYNTQFEFVYAYINKYYNRQVGVLNIFILSHSVYSNTPKSVQRRIRMNATLRFLHLFDFRYVLF